MNKKMVIVSIKFLNDFNLNKSYPIKKEDIYDFVVYVEYKTKDEVIKELNKKLKNKFDYNFEYKKDFEIFELDM